jgi:hypothetical protein
MTNEQYSGPERRKNLPTMELWQENIRALNQNSLRSCQMRYAVTRDKVTFIMRFEDEVPVGRVNFVFPVLDERALVADGWSRFVLTVSISDAGRLAVEMWGRYERNNVPLDVKAVFVRDIGLGVGIAADEISFTDARDGSTETTSLAAVVDAKMRSGERKYARKGDDVRQVSVESIIGILTRYMKDSAVRRRVMPSGR